MMPALSAKIAAIRIAFVIAVVVAASHSAQAVNDSMTALNNNRDVAFVESPGEDVNDNAGISLKVLKNGLKTVLVSNGDPLPAHCFGGTNLGNSCNSDSDCPGGGDCVQPVVSGFAKRIRMNDSGLITVRVGGTDPANFECEDGTNNGTNCTSDAQCTGGGTCTDDPDNESALITVGLGQPRTVIARTCDTVGSDVITCPDPAPDINNAGQVAFSSEINTNANFCNTKPNINTFCQDENLPPGAGYAMYRFTPGTGIEKMLAIGDTIGAFTVTVVDQENTDENGDDPDAEGRMNEKGQMLALPRYNNGNTSDNFLDAIVLLNGPGDRIEIAREGIGAGEINELEKGILNSATPTQVLYKAIDTAQGQGGTERLVLFTEGVGSQNVATEGGAVANGGTFEGFGRFFALNNNGQAAFVAGLDVPGGPGVGSGCCPEDDSQDQAIFFYNGTSLTEIARTVSADSGQGTSSFNGFQFNWFMNALALNDAGTVCFIAESSDPDTNSEVEPSALFCWSAATGIREIFRDGNIVAGGADTAIVPGMQTMQKIINANGDLAFVVDPTGSLDEIDDNFILFTTFGQGGRHAAPILSVGAMALMGMLIVGAGVLKIRRRRAV